MKIVSYRKLAELRKTLRPFNKDLVAKVYIDKIGWLEGKLSADDDGVLIIDVGGNQGPIVTDLHHVIALQIV